MSTITWHGFNVELNVNASPKDVGGSNPDVRVIESFLNHLKVHGMESLLNNTKINYGKGGQ